MIYYCSARWFNIITLCFNETSRRDNTAHNGLLKGNWFLVTPVSNTWPLHRSEPSSLAASKVAQHHLGCRDPFHMSAPRGRQRKGTYRGIKRGDMQAVNQKQQSPSNRYLLASQTHHLSLHSNKRGYTAGTARAPACTWYTGCSL